MTRTRVAALVAAASIAIVAAAAGPAVAATTVFSGAYTHTATAYAQPKATWPADIANAAKLSSTLTVTITSKPSSIPIGVQLCVWRNNYAAESCGPVLKFTDEGTQKVTSVPATWWKNANWDWSRAPEVTRLMVKDMRSGKLLMSNACGTYCYTGTNLASHVPITMTASFAMG